MLRKMVRSSKQKRLRITSLLIYLFWLFQLTDFSLTDEIDDRASAQRNIIQVLPNHLMLTGANMLKAKGKFFNYGSRQLMGMANRFTPRQGPFRRPPHMQMNPSTIVFENNPEEVQIAEQTQLIDPNAPLTFGKLQEILQQQQKLQLIQHQMEMLKEMQKGQSNPGVPPQFQQDLEQKPQLVSQLQRQIMPKRIVSGTCDERLGQLIGDIFIGNELIPQVLESPPDHPLDLTFRTQRTYPGMRLTADATRFKPILNWPTETGALYTVVMSNLDINNRINRSLSEFWHWFVANVPGTNVDDGEEIFQLLPPLVLPEGGGDHRFAYFVMKQPGKVDYKSEGGPTSNCSPTMADGRGPKRSTKEFMRKYGLQLTAATFIIVDPNLASIELACQWQACMGGEVFLEDLDCSNFS